MGENESVRDRESVREREIDCEREGDRQIDRQTVEQRQKEIDR